MNTTAARRGEARRGLACPGTAWPGAAWRGMETDLTQLEQRCCSLERELAQAREINDRQRERIAWLIGELDLQEDQL